MQTIVLFDQLTQLKNKNNKAINIKNNDNLFIDLKSEDNQNKEILESLINNIEFANEYSSNKKGTKKNIKKLLKYYRSKRRKY